MSEMFEVKEISIGIVAAGLQSLIRIQACTAKIIPMWL
jgi:hypothetical protein